MPGLNSGDIVQITILGTIGGQRTMSTFFYRVETSSTEPSYTVAALAVANGFTQGIVNPGLAFIQAAPQNWTATKVRVQRVWPTRGVYVEASPNLPGTVASDAEAFNLQASIVRKTDLAGRSEVGALHSPPLPQNATENGLITGGYTTLLNTVATRIKNEWTVTLETTKLKPVLWSPDNPFATLKYITTTLVQPEIRTMRRRTVGLGI